MRRFSEHVRALSVAATVVYALAAPGIIAGLTQFNVQIGTPPTFPMMNEFFLALNGLSIGVGVAVGPN
jgi:hypothetical protein